jgi:hypothetical protein
MILDFFDDLNWAAVVVSLVIAFAIGFVWYLPPVLGRFWVRHVSRYAGIPESEVMAGSPAGPTAKWLVGMAVNAVALALAVEAVGRLTRRGPRPRSRPLARLWRDVQQLAADLRAPAVGAVAGQQRRVPAHAGGDGRDAGRLAVMD